MNLTSPRTQNSDTSKSENYSSDCPYVRDSTTAVHSNHSQIALDFPLIYGPEISTIHEPIRTHTYKWSKAYVTQDDVLMTTLTVREAMYYSAELLLSDSLSRKDKRERAESAIMEMGLQDIMDTRIGGRNNKGISGGQRRRVSICTEILICPKLLLLDEPTSGLDSAASYHVMNSIVEQARSHGGTVIATIHQPSPEVFELFDNLCILSYGSSVYFGSTALASEFFAVNGFPCPQMRNPSDHFLRIINKDFDMDIERSGSHVSTINATEAIDILKNSYKSSSFCQEMLRQVAEISSMKGQMVKKEAKAEFTTQCWVLTRRSFVNMYRDPGYYWLRLIIYIALCASIGTIFFNIGNDYGSIQARGAMLMYIGGYLTFMAIGGFPSFVEDMKIFRRERLNGHYDVASFVISNSLSSALFLLVISLLPTIIAYFLVGLQKHIQNYIFFALMLYSSMLVVEGLMMIVASIVPDFLMGIITGAGIQGGMMLACGFFRLPNDLPKPFWKYPVHYIGFHKYVNQGLYKNEFIGLTFPSNNNGGGDSTTISGKEVVRDYWQIQVGYSKWVDLSIVFGMVFLYRFLFWVTVKLGEVKPAKQRNLMNVKQRNDQVMSSNLKSESTDWEVFSRNT
ncbi:hypothetical protein M5K25_018398 [Dendrobium thyrsiflorum]|uniref:ABC transporter domain-containing protein n=1 Tax=Dendrobium thyrsiflorum TaxID=117978 RepID=A0ABD0UPU0_DENTH